MFKRHKTFNLFYILILLFNIYALAQHNQLLRMVAMPLIGMSLILYLIIKTKLQEQFDKLIFGGLVLSMAGDIQLLFTSEAEFYLLTALIATLLGYILYSLAYFIDFKRDPGKPKRIGNILLVMLIITNVTFFSASALGDFIYPALAYNLFLAIMVVLSGYRFKRVNRSSFKLILTGSFAFVISDLSIGYYYFIEAESSMMYSFLLTYLVAQYLVVMGTIERKVAQNLS
jgi:hypothetical protein